MQRKNTAPVQTGEPSRLLRLRPYQAEIVERFHAVPARRVLLVLPTGAGKTATSTEIMRQAVEQGGRVLFLAHRRELIFQTAQTLFSAGLESGVILADHPARPVCPVQVASIQTLWARSWRSSKSAKPRADLVVVDEAHHVRSTTYAKILEDYPEARVLGLTATPCRGDGRGLGNVFDEIIEGPSVSTLIEGGFLVPTRVYAPSVPDLDGVRVKRGDYAEAELAERVDRPELVGDIVTHWHRLAGGRKTAVFATSIAHSVHIRDQFLESGVAAEHIDGNSPKDERDDILARLARGALSVVTNCAVLTEGWDSPEVSCLILARPTKSLGLYRQMVGRVLRPAPGKADALILDHSGATLAHGFAEDQIHWSLHEDERATNETASGDGSCDQPRGLKTCPECSAVRRAGEPCGACGWRPEPRARAFEVVDGDLERLLHDGRRQKEGADRRSFYAQLRTIARERGWKPTAAAAQFREKFGEWPPRAWNYQQAEPASIEVRSWVKSRTIAFAKRRSA